MPGPKRLGSGEGVAPGCGGVCGESTQWQKLFRVALALRVVALVSRPTLVSCQAAAKVRDLSQMSVYDDPESWRNLVEAQKRGCSCGGGSGREVERMPADVGCVAVRNWTEAVDLERCRDDEDADVEDQERDVCALRCWFCHHQ